MLPPTHAALICPPLQHHLNPISKQDNEGGISCCPITGFSCIISFHSDIEPARSYKRFAHIQLPLLLKCKQSLKHKLTKGQPEIYTSASAQSPTKLPPYFNIYIIMVLPACWSPTYGVSVQNQEVCVPGTNKNGILKHKTRAQNKTGNKEQKRRMWGNEKHNTKLEPSQTGLYFKNTLMFLLWLT